jgi:hypothetical protein
MSDQTSIFGSTTNSSQDNGTPSGTSTTQPNASPDPLKDLLAQIKNEQGEPKYKTVEDALKGLMHAQGFIQTLTAEKKTVEQELSALRPVAEQVTELRAVVERLTQPSTTTQQTVEVKGVSEEQVAKLVEATLSRAEQARVAKQNLEAVANAAKTVFGEKAEAEFYGRARELGMSQEEINAMAARTPKAALKLLGIEDKTQAKTGSSAPTGSINTTDFSHNTQSYIGRNPVKLQVGATVQELQSELQASRKMIDELAAKGMSIDDLTKPSNYFKLIR